MLKSLFCEHSIHYLNHMKWILSNFATILSPCGRDTASTLNYFGMNKINLFAIAALMGIGVAGMHQSAFAASYRTESVVKAAALNEKDYTMATGLQLTYAGAPMLGKTVKYIPDATDASKGTLVLTGSFDMSAIPGIPEEFKKTIAGPGVIPGSPEFRLNVTLEAAADGKSSEFKGKSGNDFVTFSYAGSVNEETLILNITEAQLKNTALVGNWKPKPYIFDEIWQEVQSDPIHIVWESEENLDLLGTQIPLGSLLAMVTHLPLIDVPEEGEAPGKCASEKLVEVLKKLSFLNDGNITADVVTAEGKAVTSPLNTVQYVATGDNAFLLYLDPTAIAAADADAKKAPRAGEGEEPVQPELPDFSKILANVMAQVTPLLANGMPMVYEKSETGLFVGIDQQVLLPILKQNVVPILENEELIQMLCSILEEDPELGSLASMIPGIASGLAKVINTTTKIQIGLDLIDYTSGVECLPAEKSDASLRIETGRYNLAGERVNSDYEGVVIIRYNDGTAAKRIVRK